MIKIIPDILTEGKNRFAVNPALKIKPRYRSLVWTYTDLYNFSTGVARLLEKKGIKKADRVIILSSNTPYWLGAFFGCLLKGAIVVPLHLQSTPEFIMKVAKETQAKVFLTGSLVKKPKGLKLPAITIDYLDDFCRKEEKFTAPDVLPEDISQILYTSGATADPRGVMLTHKNIISSLRAILHVISLEEEDRILSLLPLSHIFEQLTELRALAAGSQIVYASSLSSVEISRSLSENRITKMAVVPEILKIFIGAIREEARRKKMEKPFEFLLKTAPLLPISARRFVFRGIHKRLGGKLKLVVSGGSALDPKTAQAWRALGVQVLQGYGLTETSSVISCLREKEKNLSSVGRLIPGVEVKIAKDGEVLVKGSIVTPGYWRNPKKTKEAFEDGFLKTGDMGYFDKNGFLYIKGRKKFMILTGSGKNVYPEDIEEQLNKEKKIKDSCVVGSKKRGRTLIHAILLGSAEKEEVDKIIEKVNKKLASFQQIQEWSFWPGEDFPRTITKKVKRPEVLKYISQKRREEKKEPERISFGEDPLVRALAEVTGAKPSVMGPDTYIVKDLQLDSLMRIELTALIEDRLGVEIDEAKITPKTQVKHLAELISSRPKKKMKHRLRSWPRCAFVKKLRSFSQNALVFPSLFVLAKIEVKGKENIEGLRLPVIFMANHLSDLDTPIIFRILPPDPRRFLAVAAAVDMLYEKFWYLQPFVAFLLNTYPFPRKGQVKSGFYHTGRLLDKGWSILIFPEGKISSKGNLLPLKGGTGVLAVEMRVPVVPLRISGTNKILPPMWHLPKNWPKKLRQRVVVKIGKPIYFKKTASHEEAAKTIEASIRKL